MNNKKLIVLSVIVIALLVVAVMIKKKPETSIEKTTELVKLFPSALTVDAISKIEVITPQKAPEGAAPGALAQPETLTLLKKDDIWLLPAKANAAADKSKVEAFTKKLGEAYGELRSQSREVLSDYALDDTEAMAVSIYGKGEKPELVLLVGKAVDPKTHFVRIKDSDKVYVMDIDIRQDLGASSSDLKKPADYKRFVNLKPFSVKEEDALSVKVSYKDQLALSFDKKEEATAGEDQSKVPSESPTPLATPTEPQKKFKWEVAGTSPGFAFKADGVKNLLRKLSDLTASDLSGAADNNDAAKITSPTVASISIKHADGKETVYEFTQGAHNEGGPTSLTAKDPVTGNTYSFSPESVIRAILNTADVFELNALGMNPQGIAEVAVSGGLSFTLKNLSGTWSVDHPMKKEESDKQKLDALVNAYGTITVFGFLTANDPVENPEYVVNIKMIDGAQKALRIGSAISPDGNIRPVTVSGIDRTLLLEKRTIDSILPVWLKSP